MDATSSREKGREREGGGEGRTKEGVLRSSSSPWIPRMKSGDESMMITLAPLKSIPRKNPKRRWDGGWERPLETDEVARVHKVEPLFWACSTAETVDFASEIQRYEFSNVRIRLNGKVGRERRKRLAERLRSRLRRGGGSTERSPLNLQLP